MTIQHLAVATIALVTGALSAVSVAEANPGRIRSLTNQFEAQTRELVNLSRVRYQHVVAYRQLASQQAQLAGLAQQLQSLSRAAVPPQSMIGGAVQAQQLLASVRRHIQSIEMGPQRFLVRGDTRVVHNLLGRMEATLANLRGELSAYGRHFTGRPVPGGLGWGGPDLGGPGLVGPGHLPHPGGVWNQPVGPAIGVQPGGGFYLGGQNWGLFLGRN